LQHFENLKSLNLVQNLYRKTKNIPPRLKDIYTKIPPQHIVGIHNKTRRKINYN